MNTPADYPRPYRFVTPMREEDMARAVGDPDAVFAHKPIDIDEIERRLKSPPRHVRIGDPTRFTLLDAIVCLVVAGFIGFALAMGGF